MSATGVSADPAWLAGRRERALARAAELELPQFKGQSGWEFTPLQGLDLGDYGPAGDGDEAAFAAAEKGSVFGRLEPAAARLWQADSSPLPSGSPGSLPEGVIVAPLDVAAREHPELVERHLGSIVREQDLFTVSNEAGWTGGAFVYVPRGVTLEDPIAICAMQGAQRSALHWRTLIVLEEGARAEVWEQYMSAAQDTDGLFTTVVELVVGDNANLRYVCGQGLSDRSWVFGSQRAVIARDGVLDWVALGFGSARGRVLMETRLAGPGADAKVTGAYAGSGRQHLDFDTLQEHAAPNTTSDLAFRGILQGRSTAVWRGMIQVDAGAQRTDAFQESRNLLLSKRAHADAIPGLEIEANDVRCTHAAAIAQIDPEQLFYLRSRGLRDDVARRLVIEGFLHALVERFERGPVREALSAALERRLRALLS